MKNEIPPWAAAGAIALVALVVALVIYFGTNPGRQAKEMDRAIRATVSGPGANMGAPGPSNSAPGGASAPTPSAK